MKRNPFSKKKKKTSFQEHKTWLTTPFASCGKFLENGLVFFYPAVQTSLVRILSAADDKKLMRRIYGTKTCTISFGSSFVTDEHIEFGKTYRIFAGDKQHWNYFQGLSFKSRN